MLIRALSSAIIIRTIFQPTSNAHPTPLTAEEALIRFIHPGDLPALASLRLRSFQHTHHGGVESLAAYLDSVFVNDPWGLRDIRSLVYEGDDGEIVGFLGIIARPMVLRGETICSATLSTFMVHQEHRGRGIGRELLARYLDGPQDFSWSDVANNTTRVLWQSLGGRTAWLHNLYFHRAIRPLRSASSQWNRDALSTIARLGARPFVLLLDNIATRSSSFPSHVAAAEGACEPLTSDVIAENTADVLSEYALRPQYTSTELEALIENLNAKPLGNLYRALVRLKNGDIAGWFIYYVNPRGTAQVVQIAARNGCAATVLDHLVHHAWQSRVVALAGRMDTKLLPEMSARGFVFARNDPWVLVHSRRADVLDAIQCGEAFLSRLEGEWWMAA